MTFIGDHVRGEIGSLREQSESLMDEECAITRYSVGTLDPVTGDYTGPASAIYTGKCRVRPFGGTQGSSVVVGSLDEVLARYVVRIPSSADPVRVDDVVTVSSCDPVLDGRTFVVSHVPAESWQVDRKLIVESRG